MTRPTHDHSGGDADCDEPLLADSPEVNVFLPDEDECLALVPDNDPLDAFELDDFGLDDEERFPDERDYWIDQDEV